MLEDTRWLEFFTRAQSVMVKGRFKGAGVLYYQRFKAVILHGWIKSLSKLRNIIA